MEDNKLDTSDKGYFTSVPNMVDDLELDPYAFRLYVHIRRVTGEHGACWQSTATMAKICKMSAGSVSNAKQTLCEHGLIRIEERTDNGKMYHHITVVDIWQENMKRYARSPDEQDRSPDETKKNPIRRTHEELSATPPTGERENQRPTNFEEWFALVGESKNKQAAIVRMVSTLFPGRDPPNYGYVAKVAKHSSIKTYGRLTQLIWQAASLRPTGDVLSYCIGLSKGIDGRAADNGHGKVEQRNGKTIAKVGR